jgi:DNA-binding SARP family transcriptional activator/DNA-binding beta-propeller fold protein YncE
MEFQILGPLVVYGDDGRPCELGAGRQRALLAALILRANEVVPSDHLIDVLWGASPPRTATKALQGHVSQLRKALHGRGSGDGPILTHAPGYVLRMDPPALDSYRFERLLDKGRRALASGEAEEAATTFREALGLWRGLALAEFGFEEFAQREIARLGELRLTCLEERIEADLELGAGAELLGELEALVGDHPLHERFRCQIMLALYRSGRQAEALRQYQHARRALVDELGLDPGEELQRLERRILNHDPSLEAPVATRPEPVRGEASLARSQASGRTKRVRAPLVPADSVAIVDPESSRVVGAVRVGRRPVAVDVGHGSVWVANADDATVSRIEPQERVVTRTIGIGAPAIDLAVGPGAVWVATGSDGTVARIDPDAEAVVETIVLRGPNELVWNTTYGVAASPGALWVAAGPHHLVRVDPETNEIEAALDIGQVPVGVAVGGDTAWVATLAGRALRIEPRTNAITAETPIAYPVAVAADDEAVWVADMRGHLWRIDPDTAAVVYTTPIATGRLGIAAGQQALWVADNAEGQALRIDPRTGRIDAEVRLDHAPTDVAIGLGAAWITVQSHRSI